MAIKDDVTNMVTRRTGQTVEELLHPKEKPVGNLLSLVDAIKRLRNMPAPPKISIIGDYDADGITSATILYLSLTEFLRYAPSVRFPRRYSEGYGMNLKMVEEVDEGIILTVDNGIVANEPIALAKAKGLTVFVIDHHIPRGALPDADIIVDPHATGDEYSCYCAAGLAYRFAKELLPNSPHLRQWVALAAIGTVADMVPLIGDNRNIVRQGINALNHNEGTVGLTALVRAANLGHLDEEDIGYRIGPVFNAAGRMLDDGARMVFDVVSQHRELYDTDYDAVLTDVTQRCKRLIANNEERKSLVERAMPYANVEVKKTVGEKDGAIVIRLDIGDDRVTGIMGIVAGNVKEEHHLPTFAFAVPQGGDGSVLKGSARSYGDVHIERLLKSIDKECHLLLGFGGHAGAAGMSIRAEDLDEFRKAVVARLPERTAEAAAGQECDMTVVDDDVPDTIEALTVFAPYGMGNPPIKVRVKNVNLTPVDGKYAQVIGQKGITFKISGKTFDGVSFEGADMMENYVRLGSPRSLDVTGYLKWHFYKGRRSAQMMVEDLLPPSDTPQKTVAVDAGFMAALSDAVANPVTAPLPLPVPQIAVPPIPASVGNGGRVDSGTIDAKQGFMDSKGFIELLKSI